MSMNEDIARIFEEFATLLELTGANGFRVNAHTKVARVLEGLTVDVGGLAQDDGAMKALEAIDGIGNRALRRLSNLSTKARWLNWQRSGLRFLPGSATL